MDEAYSSGTVQDFHLIPFSSDTSKRGCGNKTLQMYGKVLRMQIKRKFFCRKTYFLCFSSHGGFILWSVHCPR